MATTNGALTPPSLPPAPSSPSLAKRKRSDTDAIVSSSASTVAPAKPQNGATRPLQTVLEDIVSILKSYDTKPSILAHSITSSITRASSGESESKRAKFTSPDGTTTIENLVQSGSYESLSALEKDVENATADILASLGTSDLSTVQPSPEETRLQIRVLAFQEFLKTLITREQARRAHLQDMEGPTDSKEEAEEDIEQPVKIKQEEDVKEQLESRTVLTIYGSAQGPKQLFSSLQQPQRIAPSNGTTSSLDIAVKVALPLRESTLPSIIGTTEVYPPPDGIDEKKKERGLTFGEVFRAPPNLPQLSPPKLAKPLSTKGSTITFSHQDSPKPGRKTSHTYANQNLSTGFWLGYGGVDVPKDPTSPTAKQKSRQRALSTGEAQLPPSEATLAVAKQAKEDALFRSAYSSFAPTRDDATAIIPEETKNRVWWQKVGEKRFNEMFPIDPELLELDEVADRSSKITTDEEEEFKNAVESFTPIEIDPALESEEKTELEKSTDEVLEEISELLETLASHQRIRNSSLATNPRTPVIQNSSLASLAGSPSNPSSEEIDVYQMLKSQLTLMIAQLPPYAVAKLNGDQLEELNISRTIIMETNDHRGVLEEDGLSRLEKPVAMLATAGTPSLNRMSSSGPATHAHYPSSTTQYARATPALHSSARPVQTPQSYYPQQQNVHRSPSVHYQRSSSGPSQGFQAPTSSYGSTPRPGFPATQAYGQQTPRATFAQATPGQYYSQRTAPQSSYGGSASSQFYQSNPQTQSQNRYQAPQPQNGYYQRSQNASQMHNYNAAPSPHARTASPLKANPSVSQPGYSSRPTYGTPASGGQMRSTYYGPSQYGNPQATPTTAPPGGYSGMSSTHQQMMLDRQQAQAAAQSQARLAAQNSFNRQGSGTPQPPPNGQYGSQQQVNGAPMTA